MNTEKPSGEISRLLSLFLRTSQQQAFFSLGVDKRFSIWSPEDIAFMWTSRDIYSIVQSNLWLLIILNFYRTNYRRQQLKWLWSWNVFMSADMSVFIFRPRDNLITNFTETKLKKQFRINAFCAIGAGWSRYIVNPNEWHLIDMQKTGDLNEA